MLAAVQADYSSHAFADGVGEYRQIFPPRDKATLDRYCKLLESAHVHISKEDAAAEELEIKRFLLRKVTSITFSCIKFFIY